MDCTRTSGGLSLSFRDESMRMERLLGSLCQPLHCLINLLSLAASENEQEWDLHLPMVMLAYRTSVQESTGCTPFYLMFGREARLPADVLFLLQHRDSRRRRTVVHFDRLKPCVALPEVTPLEENTVQRDEDRETTPLLGQLMAAVSSFLVPLPSKPFRAAK